MGYNNNTEVKLMSIEDLANEIKKLSLGERKQLFKLLGINLPDTNEFQGGHGDPLAKLVGMVKNGPSDGSKKYKEDCEP